MGCRAVALSGSVCLTLRPAVDCRHGAVPAGGPSFGLGPVLPIQAGVSTLLVLALGADTAGFVRMIDVLIGAAVGFLFNRLLLIWAPPPKD